MEELAIRFILLLLVGCKDVWSKSIDREIQYVDNSDKIVGGVDADIEDYPYQAFLLVSDGHLEYQCGGSIISTHFVVTAAHCLTGRRSIKVRIGTTYRNSGGTLYYTTTFSYHPMYNNIFTSDFDVGVVMINEGMELDGYHARAISMVRTGHDPQEGRYMIITGWGDTSENGSPSEILQKAMVPVVSRENCNEKIGDITSRMFCAAFEEGGTDTCQGDSGGPAVSSSNGRLAGITVYGYGCARPKSPGVYTRIGHYLIRNYIRAVTGV